MAKTNKNNATKETVTVLMTLDTINALSSKSLKTSLRGMLRAMDTMNKNSWVYAKHVHSIMTDKDYETDFNSAAEFARFVGLSSAMITMYVNSVTFIETVGSEHGLTTENMTVGKAYTLSTLGENVNTFLDAMAKKGYNPAAFSDKALKELVKQYKDELAKANEDEEAHAEVMEADVSVEEENDKVVKLRKQAALIKTMLQDYESHDVNAWQIEIGKLIDMILL